MRDLDLPPRCAVVHGFEALAGHRFEGRVNALCWPRLLDGDFGEVARLLAPSDGLVVVDVTMLDALSLSPAGRRAADLMAEDLARLDAIGRDPVLNCITAYPRDDRGLPIVTDVMSFHVDSAPIEADTWLCTYHGARSEGLDNDLARRRIDDPSCLAALYAASGCDDDATFAAYVRDGSFDLHYEPIEGARPFAYGVGHLWRLAASWPGSAVPPAIHRAPRTAPGDAPRLLLIC